MIDCLRVRVARAVACGALLVSGAAACGPGEPPPSFRLTSPSSDADAGAAMVTTQEMNGSYYFPVTVEATGLMLREPGQCMNMDRCGHVVLHVDDDACNVMGQSYNAIGGTATLQANASACPMLQGPHRVRADFVRDDGSAFAMPLTASGRVITLLAGPGTYTGVWTGTVSGTYTTTEPAMNTEMIMNRTATVVVGAMQPTNPREDMRITLQSNADEYWAVDAARADTAVTFRLHEYMGTNNSIPVTYTVTSATVMLRPMRVGMMMTNQMTYTLGVTFSTQNLMRQTVRGTAMYTFTGTPN